MDESPDVLGAGEAPGVPEIHRRRCAEKTARGNVFLSKAAAKRAASGYKRVTGNPALMAYRCQCGPHPHWHIGGHRKRDPLSGKLAPPKAKNRRRSK